jgi:hypothetical protein
LAKYFGTQARLVAAWVTVALLWSLAVLAGISTANSSYRVSGDVIINALGLDSFDIMVSGSSQADWVPEPNSNSHWEQGTDHPYIVNIPSPSKLLVPGTTLWSSVVVRNASAVASGNVHVSLQDAYQGDASLNLFALTQFSLICDDIALFTDVPGDDSSRMSDVAIKRVLESGDMALCRVGVALGAQALDQEYVMHRQARVVPQLLFEGVQR